MRIAVLSDIHSNLEALRAVLSHAARNRVDRYVCLGDVIGYGASPNECVEQLRGLESCSCLLGNHDAAVIGIPSNMRADARKVIHWTREVLDKQAIWFLHETEDVISWGGVSFCHSNPYRPRNWYYVTEKSKINRSFARSRAKILFLGHTHVPVAMTRKNFLCVYIRPTLHSSVIPIAHRNRQLFNCGSVGQPRDGDPRASYLIYDESRQVVEFYRVAYDIASAAQKILDAGLPKAFAERLFEGV